jgi:hypothetical protein
MVYERLLAVIAWTGNDEFFMHSKYAREMRGMHDLLTRGRRGCRGNARSTPRECSTATSAVVFSGDLCDKRRVAGGVSRTWSV